MLFYLIYILTGAFAGTLSGLLGIAGGIIIVPILALTLAQANGASGLAMHMAAGTSLAAVCITSLFSTYSHNRRHNILWHLVGKLTPGIILGTIIGGLLASTLSSQILVYLFASFLLIIALYMLIYSEANSHWQLPTNLILFFITLAIGIISGLLGVGGGVIIAPLLIVFNIPTRIAAGTSAACGISITLVGTLVYLVIGFVHTGCISLLHCGYIYWPAAVTISVASILFIPLGAFLSNYLPVVAIKKIFILLLIVTAIKMFWN
ncbi:sulfite exporter TauE/SafE family protein [soil metagenome]